PGSIDHDAGKYIAVIEHERDAAGVCDGAAGGCRLAAGVPGDQAWRNGGAGSSAFAHIIAYRARVGIISNAAGLAGCDASAPGAGAPRAHHSRARGETLRHRLAYSRVYRTFSLARPPGTLNAAP